MSAPHYIVRGDLSDVGADLQDDQGKLVAWADSAERAHFLAEAHNAYVPALRKLIELLHHDAIPVEWEDRSVRLDDVVDRITELVGADSIGAPAQQEGALR